MLAEYRSRASGLASYVRRLHEASENALHRHATGVYHHLDPHLRAAHLRAKDASHLVDHFAKNWPESQRRFLHQKASEEHTKAAQKLSAAGFTDLAQTHLQWAHTHGAHAAQHRHESLVHLPASGGHARSGHTLPGQPPSIQHFGDLPTSAPSAQKAQQNDQSWNQQSGDYQEIPKSVRKLQRRAEVVSQSVDRISLDPNFSDEERANHQRTAAGHHVAAAEELLRHGFRNQADQHMRRAQKHTQRAGAHDAEPRHTLKKESLEELAKRMDIYRRHPKTIVNQTGLRRKLIGKVAGFKVFTVDGAYVRKALDIDFVAGGNPGRYSYVPEGEIWVEDVYKRPDVLYTIYHEIIETLLMIRDGMSYGRAHDIAAKYELRLRKSGEHPSLKALEPMILKAYETSSRKTNSR